MADMSRRQKLPDEVAGFVREQILSGELKQGAFLRMERLAETLGVSTTPVREGLLKLSGEGVVTPVPRRGFVVAEITRDDVRDIFWVQGQLAGELAARAALRLDAQGLAELQRLHDESNDAIARGEIERAVDLRQQFHRAINLAAGAARLRRLLLSAIVQLPTTYYTMEGHAARVAPIHSQILEALRARDPERARLLTQQHRQGVAAKTIELLESRGFWGPVVDHDAIDGDG